MFWVRNVPEGGGMGGRKDGKKSPIEGRTLLSRYSLGNFLLLWRCGSSRSLLASWGCCPRWGQGVRVNSTVVVGLGQFGPSHHEGPSIRPWSWVEAELCSGQHRSQSWPCPKASLPIGGLGQRQGKRDLTVAMPGWQEPPAALAALKHQERCPEMSLAVAEMGVSPWCCSQLLQHTFIWFSSSSGHWHESCQGQWHLFLFIY